MEKQSFKPVILSSKKEMKEEKIKFHRIRLFKGSKSHSNYPTNCLLILHVIYLPRSPNGYPIKYQIIYPVDAITFFSNAEEAKRYIYMAANESGYPFSVETIRILANNVANFLFSCFRFNATSFSKPTTPMHIIMADIFISIGIGGLPMIEPYSRHENWRNYIICFKDIDDSIKHLFVDPDNLESKEFIMHQVEPLVKKVCYNNVEDIIDDGETCSICFDSYKNGTKVMLTPCSHKFHAECLMEWMLRGDSCPLCRGLCVKHV